MNEQQGSGTGNDALRGKSVCAIKNLLCTGFTEVIYLMKMILSTRGRLGP